MPASCSSARCSRSTPPGSTCPTAPSCWRSARAPAVDPSALFVAKARELALAEAHRVLRPGGWLAVFDGDYATMTLGRDAADPLQSCAEAFLEMVVHDPWLMRRVIPLLERAGFAGARLRGHAYTSSGAGSDYCLALVDRGADALAARGIVGAEPPAALKAEGRARMADGSFFGHIAYASAVATRG